MENTNAITATPPTGGTLSRANPATAIDHAGDKLASLSKKSAAVKAQLTDQSNKIVKSQEESVEHLNGLEEQLKDAIQTLNDSLARTPTKANISHDDVLNRYVVRIADKQSGEIVREIPSEDLLKFARHLEKLKGILFDKEA